MGKQTTAASQWKLLSTEHHSPHTVWTSLRNHYAKRKEVYTNKYKLCFYTGGVFRNLKFKLLSQKADEGQCEGFDCRVAWGNLRMIQFGLYESLHVYQVLWVVPLDWMYITASKNISVKFIEGIWFIKEHGFNTVCSNWFPHLDTLSPSTPCLMQHILSTLWARSCLLSKLLLRFPTLKLLVCGTCSEGLPTCALCLFTANCADCLCESFVYSHLPGLSMICSLNFLAFALLSSNLSCWFVLKYYLLFLTMWSSSCWWTHNTLYSADCLFICCVTIHLSH